MTRESVEPARRESESASERSWLEAVPTRITVDPIRQLRRFLIALLYFGMTGAAVELFLLEHTEHWQQWIPFVVLALGFVAATVAAFRPTPFTVRAFRVVMLAFIATGLVGVYLHYRGNVEFELEMVPALRGRELIWKSLKGATPIGAPGFMTQLGLLGLASTFRHPRLTRAA